MKEHGKSLTAKTYFPVSIFYHPDIDVSNELGPQEAAYYQSIIGIICWIVELGYV